MRKLSIFALLLFATPLLATVRTVKAGGGGDCTVIQTCVNLMAAGDTTTVFAGTYNEAVTLSAGTAGNYKTLNVNPGDTVNVFRFTLASHTKVDGFHIGNAASPSGNACTSIPTGITDFFITNNVMQACGSSSDNGMIFGPLSTTPSTFAYIAGNTMSYSCSTPGSPNTCGMIMVQGNHWLVENNDFSHFADAFTVFGSQIVIRNNLFHDVNTNECGSNSSNCHIDVAQSEPSSGVVPPASFNLYEGNTVKNMLQNGCPSPINSGCDTHIFLTQADACGGAVNCHNVIIRFNNAEHVHSYGLLDNSGGFTFVKTYNNTFADVAGGGCGSNGETTDAYYSNSTNGAEFNNIYYYPQNCVYPPYSVDAGSASGFTAGSNLAFCTTGACPLLGRNFSGTFVADAPGNIKADPLFVNYAAFDLHLQATSPAKGAGRNLTTAVGGGSSSTSLTVADASFFQDSLGLSALGVQADWIRIGASTTVQISSINYGTNIITLASPVSWNNSDPIYLYKNSSGVVVLNSANNGDIGAFPFGIVSAPPVATKGVTAIQ